MLKVIRRALKETHLDPQYLELELTESIMQNAEAISTLRALKAMGVEIALDDFGTGYSSLNYLKRFPIGKLKIDRSFVRDIPEDNDNTVITTTIVAMAHSLNMKVTAEGVETVAQMEFLHSLNCDEMQGHLFSKPIPADEMAALLLADRRKPWTPLRDSDTPMRSPKLA